MSLWMTRARLRKDASVATLAPMLLPDEFGARVGASHRLAWSLFAGDDDAKRSFLWRETKPRELMALSPDQPQLDHPLLTIETKPFTPKLAAGDRLSFDLRVNATIDSKVGGKSVRSDIVMAAIKSTPAKSRERRQARDSAMHGSKKEAGLDSAIAQWLTKRAEVNGFTLECSDLRAYETLKIPRHGTAPIELGICEVVGILTVSHPAMFLDRIGKGFGRGKGFGCGLMLIRRAAS